MQLELSGLVFTAECFLVPFFHSWPCARFPHHTVLLRLQDGDQCSLCHLTALARSRSSVFQVIEHSGLHPDLVGLPLERSLRLEGLTAGLCHYGSLHTTDLPTLTLTEPLGFSLFCFNLNHSFSLRHLSLCLLFRAG